jgi:predicted DNA repair protein MutK
MVPGLLRSLSSIGTAAMLWVGGGILLHGMEDIGLERFPHTVHEVANKIAASFGPIEGAVAWIANALAAAIVGAIVGTLIVLVVRQFTSHPEKLIVDA